ncbi:Trehalose and maltose hydrolases (possible phosphorylases) [Sedimentisphaera cyanobacteriorum]|uniref:Trehalose and maltose hydrolases (Possible phosphorylases) n=1 Tax=Sedimentisphaera cyanobacteriorum TaxID=1940790 RepID=A0A1Q2HNT6_9BACT|nr:glycoside hydrolase family 95 protein [Sedimentisphaera cyanobacteriorum]AQQ08991.1 Trehalose and maltose hydrolases (possible phosphorylases) [Sedimentisphaera cyanobacteriorum]
MKLQKSTHLSFVFILNLLLTLSVLAAGSSCCLWYDEPAEQWTEALAVGSGRLGAMVFGGIGQERIQLNEDTVWAGPPVPETNEKLYPAFKKARRLLFDGKYEQAESAVQAALPERIVPRSYQTLGDLIIDFDIQGDAKDYKRSLDLENAVCKTEFTAAGSKITREVFASRPGNVTAVKISSSKPESLSFSARLSRPADFQTKSIGQDMLSMTGQASHNGKQKGVKYCCLLKASTPKGKIDSQGNELTVRNAGTAVILITAKTDYNMDDPYQPLNADLEKECRQILEKASSSSYEKLKREHIKDYKELYERMNLKLPEGEVCGEPSDQRLEAVANGAFDPSFTSLYFNFGRYLLISSSRPGTMPANLQGIWNHHIAAPWNSDYHVNINMQMNYWPAEVCNLSECHQPFFDFIERVYIKGRKTAQKAYGARGTVIHHTTDPWLFTAPFGKTRCGYWPFGAAWCSSHFMEHYRYTQDLDFLRDRAYPALKANSLFLLDYLAEDPETDLLTAGPAGSPENSFKTKDGKEGFLDMGASMSQQITWDVFTNTIEAAEVLGIDNDFIRNIKEAKQRLALPKIGEDGRLMEWSEDFEEPSPGHRHISHAYGLHPGRQYNFANSPAQTKAVKKSVEYRLSHGGGHTGWSRAWIINIWARLKQSEKAHSNLISLYRKSTHPNLFDNHPPFQIDGNFGAAAGVAEMLMQSHTGVIELLPALPKAWSDGEINGLKARGGYEISIKWKNAVLTEVAVISSRKDDLALRYKDKNTEIPARKGIKYKFNKNLEIISKQGI